MTKLSETLKQGYFTVTTIAKDDLLQDSFDTWLDVNGQRFGIIFDTTAIEVYYTNRFNKAIGTMTPAPDGLSDYDLGVRHGENLLIAEARKRWDEGR